MLVGHGTRDSVGTAEFFQLGECLADQLAGNAIVRPCLLEFQTPTIAQAFGALVAQGVGHVIVAPLLLFSAGHAKGDIPGEVAAAQAAIPGSLAVQVRYARPISRQTAMVDAVRARLRETLCRAAGGTEHLAANRTTPDRRTAIVMVGRGSRDVCARSDMRTLSEVAVRGRAAETGSSLAHEFKIPSDGLFTTFYAMAVPRLPNTLCEVVTSGKFDRIIVQPHLLFAGRLYDAITQQTDLAAAAHPKVRFDISPYLGPCDSVAMAIAARIREVA